MPRFPARRNKKKKFHLNEVVLVINATKTDLLPYHYNRRHCMRAGKRVAFFVIVGICCYCLRKYAVKKKKKTAESSFGYWKKQFHSVYILFSRHGCFSFCYPVLKVMWRFRANRWQHWRRIKQAHGTTVIWTLVIFFYVSLQSFKNLSVWCDSVLFFSSQIWFHLRQGLKPSFFFYNHFYLIATYCTCSTLCPVIFECHALWIKT